MNLFHVLIIKGVLLSCNSVEQKIKNVKAVNAPIKFHCSTKLEEEAKSTFLKTVIK